MTYVKECRWWGLHICLSDKTKELSLENIWVLRDVSHFFYFNFNMEILTIRLSIFSFIYEYFKNCYKASNHAAPNSCDVYFISKFVVLKPNLYVLLLMHTLHLFQWTTTELAKNIWQWSNGYLPSIYIL